MSAPRPAPAPLGAVRGASYLALLVAFAHVVFGAIVRITGSGMGCGDNWPRCADPATGELHWFPPFDRPTLVIEWTHRLLASILITVVVALVVVAWRSRRAAGGPGGPLRAALLALGLVLFAAIFGAVTVFYGNPAWATVVHKVIAASLLATLAAAAVRAGGLGAAGALPGTGTRKAIGGATAAAALALAVVALGGLTAKIPDAAIACRGFPLCGAGSLGGGAEHVQLTHRVLAYLLVLHLLSLPFVFRKRGEAPAVRHAAACAAALGLLQVAWAGWMVTGGFPAVVRSLHQATGVAIWLVAFTMAYLARTAAGARAHAAAGVPRDARVVGAEARA